MSAAARVIVAEAARLGLELMADRGRIRFRPASAASPELRQRIADARLELLGLLPERAPQRPCHACGGVQYWRLGRLSTGLAGRWVCRRCHPPAGSLGAIELAEVAP